MTMADNFQIKAAPSSPVTLATSESGSVHTLKTAATAQASENHIGEVGGAAVIAPVILSLDTNAYADGDVLADTQEIASAMRVNNGTGILESVVVADLDDQGVALDLIILQTNVALGTENDAASPTDAFAREVLAIIEVAAGDFVDLVNSKVAIKQNLGIMVQSASASTSLYVAAISRGTGTYTASGIELKLGFKQN